MKDSHMDDHNKKKLTSFCYMYTNNLVSIWSSDILSFSCVDSRLGKLSYLVTWGFCLYTEWSHPVRLCNHKLFPLKLDGVGPVDNRPSTD